ncbi:MAG: carbohydrate deacetylase [Anaerolineae bacterium]
MLKRLIVNADDLGYTPGVTRGIIRAHQKGIVTSTSVMINMPHGPEGVLQAMQEAPALGLGLHLTLTAGRPVLPPAAVPGLVREDGSFRRKEELIAGLHTLNIEEVQRELEAQIDRFTRTAGRPPDHLDSHHHITYLSPPLLALTMKLAADLGVPIRNPLAGDEETSAQALIAMGITASETVAWELANTLTRMVQTTGVKMPDYFIADFYGARVILGDLLNILMEVPEGVSELMCHPAEVDDLLRETSGYTDARAKELESLTHPSAREVCNSQFIQLINFGDLR